MSSYFSGGETRWVHHPKGAGSNPASATKTRLPQPFGFPDAAGLMDEDLGSVFTFVNHELEAPDADIPQYKPPAKLRLLRVGRITWYRHGENTSAQINNEFLLDGSHQLHTGRPTTRSFMMERGTSSRHGTSPLS